MDYRTLDLLFRCGRRFNHEKIRRQELSETEYMICSYVFSHENCSQDEISAALKTDKTTVGKALAELEKENCVARTADTADRRIKRTALTDAGKKRVGELLSLHNDWLAEIMTCLTAEEKMQFESCCEKLLAAAEKLTQNNER